jgi:hypothetical protein
MNKDLIKLLLKEIAVEHVPNNSVDAFGAGLAIGKEEREKFNFTGDVANLSAEEAMSVGYEAGKTGADDHEDIDSAEYYVENPDILADWVGIRRHSIAPHEESYRKVGDLLAMNPESAYQIVQPLMDKTGATCKVSAAKAVADILEIITAQDNKPI